MRVATVLAVVSFLALAPMLLYLAPQVVGGERAYVVLSGSMGPTIAAGDYIVVRGFSVGDPLHPGDIITYRSGKNLVTHRAIEILGAGNERQVVTQGDANGAPDARPIDESSIVGVYMFHVPLYGHVVAFATQPIGRAAFIFVPSLALLITQVAKLVRMASAAQQRASSPTGSVPASVAGSTVETGAPPQPAGQRKAKGASIVARGSATTLTQPSRALVLGVRR